MNLNKIFIIISLLIMSFLQACNGTNLSPDELQAISSVDTNQSPDAAVGDTTENSVNENTSPLNQENLNPSVQGKIPSPDLAMECVNLALSSNALDIGAGLPDSPSPYEPSGADWHSRLKKVFGVHDNGYLFMMNKNGSNVVTWNIGGDLEGVTIADPQSPFVYIGREFPAAILEFNIDSGVVTRTFSLGAFMPESSSQGLEALTFVEKEGNPERGEFWAGHQGNGNIYVFNLPIVSSRVSTTVTRTAILNPVPGRTDISGMDYSSEFDVVYVIYDSNNRLTIVDPEDAHVYLDRNFPQNDQEGIAVNDLCDLFIAQDTNKKFWFYKGRDEVVINKQVAQLLADRVAAVQNENGSYDWKHLIEDPLNVESEGFQNVTGVSVWGFFNAIDLLEDESYWNPIENSVTYFDNRIDALLADPHNSATNLSCPNFTVLSQYLQSHPDAVLKDRVINALNTVLDARDNDFGSDPSMRVEGLFNLLIARRASIPGIIPWDMALCVEALGSMGQISSDFENDYRDSLSLLDHYVREVFDPAYDADNTMTYADASLSMPLFVFVGNEFSSLYSDVILELTTRLENLVDENGLITNGSENSDGLEQPSAYGLLALKKIKSSYAQRVQNFLESRIDAQGRIYDLGTREETYEVEGEVLRAITSR